ncbi:hypothetical protein HK097_009009, partial [Rhizophlyctis rosea]
MLKGILRLIPSGPSFMLPLLTENFPHKREDLTVHIHYVRNIFQIIEYAPVLRNKILALVIDRVMHIDVDIQSELEDLTDEEWDQVIRAITKADTSIDPQIPRHTLPSHTTLFDQNGRPILASSSDDSDDDIDFNDSDSEDGASVIEIKCIEVVEKLDGVLRFVFQYLKEFGRGKEEEELADVFWVMLDIFDRSVLTTHRMRCAQFLWFYVASLHPTFPDQFVAFLVERVIDTTRPDIIRISAAAYLGSFLARAKFIQMPTVRQAVEVLTSVAKDIAEGSERDF